MPLVDPRMSGVGHVTLHAVRALAGDEEIQKKYDLQLIIPINKLDKIERWNFPEQVHIKKNLIPGKIMNGFTRFGVMPWMDLFFGKGVYLFPNGKNWPLLMSRSLTYIHDLTYLYYPESMEERNRQVSVRWGGRWVRRADVIITVSKSVQKEIIKEYNIAPDKMVVVPNGYEKSLFYPAAPKEIARVQAKYPELPEKYFMYLSNFEPRKDIPTLLTAFEELPEAIRSEYGLLMVGGMGWGNEEILEHIKQMQAKGMRVLRPENYVPDEDLAGLLSGATALLHPAVYEGFGITPLEAMACGTPAVITDIPVLREVGGDAALFFKPHDHTALSAAIVQLVKDKKLREKLAEKGLIQAAKFTWKQSLQPLLNLLKDKVQ